MQLSERLCTPPTRQRADGTRFRHFQFAIDPPCFRVLHLCSISELKGALSENRRILYRQNEVQETLLFLFPIYRRLPKLDVAGSNPVSRSIKSTTYKNPPFNRYSVYSIKGFKTAFSTWLTASSLWSRPVCVYTSTFTPTSWPIWSAQTLGFTPWRFEKVLWVRRITWKFTHSRPCSLRRGATCRRQLGIPVKLNALSEGKPNTFRDEPEHHRSVATLASRLCGKVFGFVKRKPVRSAAKEGRR
jgi:hypothetical protein